MPIAGLLELNHGDGMSIQQWLTAAITGMIYYGVAFLMYLKGLQAISAGKAGLYLNLIPVFTIGLAYWILGEVLRPTQWIGAAVVLAAVCTISLSIAHTEPHDTA